MNKTRTTILAATLTLAAIAPSFGFAVPSKAATSSYQPDEWVSRETRDSLGDNVYNTTGVNQSVRAAVHAGRGDYFFVDTQNDGTVTDSIVVTGCSSKGHFTVKYTDSGTDVTSQVTGPGLTESSLASGGVVPVSLKLTIKSSANANPGDKFICRVAGTSVGDSGTSDVVVAKVSVR